jgi:hypothetical protein
MPERIQLRRTKGWRMPPNTVKVDRSTRWGNPFVDSETTPDCQAYVITRLGIQWLPDDWWTREEVVRLFELWASGRWPDDPARPGAPLPLAAAVRPIAPDLAPLRGKNLACWCKPGAPCHADALLRLVNASPTPPTPDPAA